jgi:hypothetical protein
MELQKNQKIIEEVVSPSEKSKEENTREFILFRENFNLILEYGDFIIKKPELYYSALSGFSINLAYFGGHQAPLGVLLELWRDGILVCQCEICGGKFYIFCAGGSPLSGTNRCTGICEKCKTVSSIQLSSTRPIIKALSHLKKNLNIRKILKTKGQHFSFKDGLVGEPIPDQIIEKSVIPATIEELINEIKNQSEI